MTAGAQTTAVAPVRTRAKALTGGHGDPTRRGGWLSRITLILVCFLWTVPTVGLLITSFRSKEDATSSGWWTTLTNPFETTWTTETSSRPSSTTTWGPRSSTR